MKLFLLSMIMVAAALVSDAQADTTGAGAAVQPDPAGGAVEAAQRAAPPPLHTKDAFYSYVLLAVIITASTWLLLKFFGADSGYSTDLSAAAAAGSRVRSVFHDRISNATRTEGEAEDFLNFNARTRRRFDYGGDAEGTHRGNAFGGERTRGSEEDGAYRTFGEEQDGPGESGPTEEVEDSADSRPRSFRPRYESSAIDRLLSQRVSPGRNTTAFNSTSEEHGANNFKSRYEEISTMQKSPERNSTSRFSSAYYDRVKELTSSAFKETSNRLRRFSFQRSDLGEEWVVERDSASIGTKFPQKGRAEEEDSYATEPVNNEDDGEY